MVAFDQLALLFGGLAVTMVASLGARQRWAAAVTTALLAGVAAAVTILGLSYLLAAATPGSRPAATPPWGLGTGLGLMLTGGVGAWSLLPLGRRFATRLLGTDPDSSTDLTAIALSLTLIGVNATLQLTTDVLGQQAQGPGSTPLDLVLQEIPFLLAALFGTGWLIRRDLGASLGRLGLVRPSLFQVVLGLAAAGLFVAFSAGIDQLSQWLTPDLARHVQAANDHLQRSFANPVGVIVIALVPGICEEALFRGGLQPRIGLVFVALVFTAVHTQYGLSLDALAVLVLALMLGLIRRHANTTTSSITHVAYNATVGVSALAWWTGPAVAVEVALLAALAFLWWRRRRGSPTIA